MYFDDTFKTGQSSESMMANTNQIESFLFTPTLYEHCTLKQFLQLDCVTLFQDCSGMRGHLCDFYIQITTILFPI
jgi:hypothetical protein